MRSSNRHNRRHIQRLSLPALRVDLDKKGENNMNDDWHKALVLVLRKLGIVEILITQADMDQVQKIENDDARPCALAFQQDDGIHIKLVTNEEARELSSIGLSRPN